MTTMMMMGLCEFLLPQLLNSSYAIHRRQQIENIRVALEITTTPSPAKHPRYKLATGLIKLNNLL